MTDIYEVSIFDSSDDDISLAAAEEVGLLSSQQKEKSHRRTSSIDHFVLYTKRTVRETLSDLDFIHHALSIALLAVLWHTFSLAISIVPPPSPLSHFRTLQKEKDANFVAIVQ